MNDGWVKKAMVLGPIIVDEAVAILESDQVLSDQVIAAFPVGGGDDYVPADQFIVAHMIGRMPKHQYREIVHKEPHYTPDEWQRMFDEVISERRRGRY